MKQNRYLIYGLSKSGEAAFNLIFNKKDKFYLYDDDKQKRKIFYEKTQNLYNVFLLNKIEKVIVNFVDTIIISPGVSIYNPIIEYAKRKKIEIISELELGFRFCKNKMIAITGTNGKTTTVSLLYDIFKTAGFNVEKVGNIGNPLSSVVRKVKRKSILICEVSSFQLEAINKFNPQFSGILNITTDHIDRHKTFENYKKTKYKIFKNLNKKVKVVLNQNLKVLSLRQNKNQIYKFGFKKCENGCYVDKENIIYSKNNKEEVICCLSDVNSLRGNHNLENIMACICFAKFFKIKNKYILEAIKNFKNISHRIQKIYQTAKNSFYDDSKATNIDATIKAINSFNEDVFLILGGSDKGYSYDEIFKSLPQKVKDVVACGETANKICKTASKYNIKIKAFKNLKEATIFACENLKEGQSLLLSPASASFDEFKNYKDRGEKFLNYIKEFYE
ncbi:MAG: UDP-N-acetylmuramoyl-L-alanine--D-glutamate ligase [Clostridia bacterium]|nr:UDP-N-acetylmuramoyl-L-alanine--D-glutamate ligase [Clostridia bacterium]